MLLLSKRSAHFGMAQKTRFPYGYAGKAVKKHDLLVPSHNGIIMGLSMLNPIQRLNILCIVVTFTFIFIPL